jgi:hypothetical protein
MRQRESEKRGNNSSSSPQGTTTNNPDAMQVDASRQQQQSGSAKPGQKTRADYMKYMQGKCFGCGSKDHAKKDGKHERDVCNHCGKTGHRSTVCFTKFLGKPGKTAGAAATSDSTDSTPSSSASATNETPAKDSKTQADLLAQLMEKVKAQEAQINALKASF